MWSYSIVKEVTQWANLIPCAHKPPLLSTSVQMCSLRSRHACICLPRRTFKPHDPSDNSIPRVALMGQKGRQKTRRKAARWTRWIGFKAGVSAGPIQYSVDLSVLYLCTCVTGQWTRGVGDFIIITMTVFGAGWKSDADGNPNTKVHS